MVDKAASLTLGSKVIISGRLVSWWDEELHQLVKNPRACFAQGLDNDSNWSDYLRIHKELKRKLEKNEKFVESS